MLHLRSFKARRTNGLFPFLKSSTSLAIRKQAQKQQMAAPHDIDREQVKLLVMRVGCTDAAKELGIPLNTVLSWSARGKWLKPSQPDLPPTVKPRAITAIKPSDALANVLSKRKQKINDHLSRYLINASKVAMRSRSPLKDAADVRHVAAIKQAVFPEESGHGNGFSLNVLSIGGDMTISSSGRITA